MKYLWNEILAIFWMPFLIAAPATIIFVILLSMIYLIMGWPMGTVDPGFYIL